MTRTIFRYGFDADDAAYQGIATLIVIFRLDPDTAAKGWLSLIDDPLFLHPDTANRFLNYTIPTALAIRTTIDELVAMLREALETGGYAQTVDGAIHTVYSRLQKELVRQRNERAERHG